MGRRRSASHSASLVDQALNSFITMGKLIARLRETVPQARHVDHLE
jgi:hypothetical protein